MLEVYCDSSFNERGASFIGCVAVRNGVEVCQSTARVVPDPRRNLECELAAIRFGIAVARLFPDPDTIIYNDSTEAVKEFQANNKAGYAVEFTGRETPYQSLADRLSKRFPQALVPTHDLCKKPVGTFTPEVLEDVANGRTVIYLEKNERETTNTRTVYSLVVRNIDGVISDDKKYEAKAGEVKNVKVARDISRDPAVREMGLEGAYFLLTDETWGLRRKGGEAYSILPCDIGHRIICHEVDRGPENLFNRAAASKKASPQ